MGTPHPLPLALVPPGSQESAADPGEEAGQLHPLGSRQHPGGPVPQVPIPAVRTPRQRPHDGKPHQHLLRECLCSARLPAGPRRGSGPAGGPVGPVPTLVPGAGPGAGWQPAEVGPPARGTPLTPRCSPAVRADVPAVRQAAQAGGLPGAVPQGGHLQGQLRRAGQLPGDRAAADRRVPRGHAPRLHLLGHAGAVSAGTGDGRVPRHLRARQRGSSWPLPTFRTPRRCPAALLSDAAPETRGGGTASASPRPRDGAGGTLRPREQRTLRGDESGPGHAALGGCGSVAGTAPAGGRSRVRAWGTGCIYIFVGYFALIKAVPALTLPARLLERAAAAAGPEGWRGVPVPTGCGARPPQEGGPEGPGSSPGRAEPVPLAQSSVVTPNTGGPSQEHRAVPAAPAAPAAPRQGRQYRGTRSQAEAWPAPLVSCQRAQRAAWCRRPCHRDLLGRVPPVPPVPPRCRPRCTPGGV